MTALVLVRCAWTPLLCPAALQHTAALQSQAGNPWCWSGCCLVSRPEGHSQPDPKMSVLLRFAEPGESLSPESRGSRERGKILTALPPAQSLCWGSSLVSSRWRGAAHMAPRVEIQALTVPLDYLSSPPGEGSVLLQLVWWDTKAG